MFLILSLYIFTDDASGRNIVTSWAEKIVSW
jgi:hydroxymethylglutaryl-CoA reductase